jgi:hypothetical protein
VAVARTYVCDDCGAAGVQLGGGKLQKRCDECRAGSGGNAPRKRDVTSPERSPRPRPAHQAARTGAGLRQAVQDDLAALMTAHPMADGLRELAVDLAGRVESAEDKTVPALARELRSTLEALASYREREASDDEDDVDLSAEVLDPPFS